MLDGIRAIAYLSVIMFHINLITTKDITLWIPQSIPTLFSALAFSGDTGITLFFVLSGFLLFLPYAKSLLFEEKWPSTWQFYLFLPWIALAIRWFITHTSPHKRFLTLTICLGIMATWGILTRWLGIYLTTYPQATIILPPTIMQ